MEGLKAGKESCIYNAAFCTWHGHCTHKLTELWLSADPYSSLDGGETHKAAPTVEELLATDGCCVFVCVCPLVGCPYSSG